MISAASALSAVAARSLRVAYLTAGAGNMYCGSCIHDNTLVAALRAAGRDITLLPLYTPIRTDEPDVSEACVLYGGVNVYLQQTSSIFRWLPFGLDRLLDRPGFIRGVMKRFGDAGVDASKLGPMTVSMLRGERGAQKREVRKLIVALIERRPDLVVLPDALFLGLAEPLRRELRVPILCSLTGEDLFLGKLPPRYHGECDRLMTEGAHHVDGFIATSRYYGAACARRWSIPAERVHAIPLGVRTDDALPRNAAAGDPPVIGYLSRICADKGLHVLCDAFIALHRSGVACRLAIAGYLSEADRKYMEEQERKLSEAGLWGDVTYAGSPNRAGKLEFLRSLDLFCVPGVYHEAKGLPLLEAMAHAVPVVQPAHGSYVEIVEQTGGGVLYQPDAASSSDGADGGLVDALQEMIADGTRRAALGCRGREMVLQSFSAEAMAGQTWALFERCAAEFRRS